MIKIVFICTANICRSPMAEGVLRHKAEQAGRDDIEVSSMGVRGLDNQPASEFARETCRENGIDISEHRSRPISGEELQEADLILCMEPIHVKMLTTYFPWYRDRVFLMGAWPDKPNRKSPVKDPMGKPMKTYRKAFDQIAAHADRILENL